MNAAPLVVGLSGKKRAGKDTFARVLVEERGFHRVAFADPLREAALALDPIVALGPMFQSIVGEPDARVLRLSQVVEGEGWEAAKERPEVRRTLQRYGVAIREIDPGFWIRAALRTIEAVPGPIVVTDVRFPNEAEAISDLGGHVVRVNRPGLASADEHESETALDDYPFDLVVENASTVESFEALAREITF